MGNGNGFTRGALGGCQAQCQTVSLAFPPRPQDQEGGLLVQWPQEALPASTQWPSAEVLPWGCE